MFKKSFDSLKTLAKDVIFISVTKLLGGCLDVCTDLSSQYPYHYFTQTILIKHL